MSPKQQPFEVNIRKISGEVIIDLSGEINSFAEADLNTAFEEVVNENPKTVMLNFGQVSYINSTGIALIVGLMAEARKHHISLVTYGLSDHYAEIFHITRLSDFMTIAADEATALAQVEAA